MKVSGQCLCGSVRFGGTPRTNITVCHCGQCRRWASGPFFAVRFEGGITFEAEETLHWFRSSETGERGFCTVCGSSMFWRVPGQGNDISASANLLEPGHGLSIERHIWVDDKPDFYDFADDAPRLTAAEAMRRQG